MRHNFHVSSHPVIKHKLTHLRRHEKDVPSRQFTQLMREMGRLLAYEATADLPLMETKRHYQAYNGGEIPARTLGPKKPVIVPILRGGLVLAEGLQDVIPTTYTGHIGMHFDAAINPEPIVYLITLPPDTADRHFILVDPVIATGVTACRAIRILADLGVNDEYIRFVCVVSSRFAQEAIRDYCQGVKVFCAEIDEGLDRTIIRPGLGPVSARLYRTS